MTTVLLGLSLALSSTRCEPGVALSTLQVSVLGASRPVLAYGSSVTEESVEEVSLRFEEEPFLTANGWKRLEAGSLIVLIHAPSVGLTSTLRLAGVYASLEVHLRESAGREQAVLDRSCSQDKALLTHLGAMFPAVGQISDQRVEASLSLGVVVGVETGGTDEFVHVSAPQASAPTIRPSAQNQTTESASSQLKEQRGGEIRFLGPRGVSAHRENQMRAIAMRLVASEIQKADEARKAALDRLLAVEAIAKLANAVLRASSRPDWVVSGLKRQLGDRFDDSRPDSIKSVTPSLTITLSLQTKSGPELFSVSLLLE